MKNQVIIQNFCKREKCLDKFIYNLLHFGNLENFTSNSLILCFIGVFNWHITPEGYNFWYDKYKLFTEKYRDYPFSEDD